MNSAAQFNTDNGCYTVKKMSETLFSVSAGEKVLGFVERAGSVWVASRAQKGGGSSSLVYPVGLVHRGAVLRGLVDASGLPGSPVPVSESVSVLFVSSGSSGSLRRGPSQVTCLSRWSGGQSGARLLMLVSPPFAQSVMWSMSAVAARWLQPGLEQRW